MVRFAYSVITLWWKMATQFQSRPVLKCMCSIKEKIYFLINIDVFSKYNVRFMLTQIFVLEKEGINDYYAPENI